MAIVYVEVAADPSSPNPQPTRGTGFIISGDGYVLTARHVVSGYINRTATPIRVRIGSLNGIHVTADLHPMNIGVDVALLKLPNPIGVGLPAYHTVQRGNAKYVPIGGELYIIGFNSGSDISLQQGSLSSNFGTFQWEITNPGTIFGMSGAPVFDKQGQVVAIVSEGRPGTSLSLVWPEPHLESFAAIAGWARAASVLPNPTPVTVKYTICSGEYEHACKPHDVYLYCYSDVSNWAKSKCASHTVQRLDTYGGNRCGYAIDAVICTGPK